jgi:opacity protein-like surface antigen
MNLIKRITIGLLFIVGSLPLIAQEQADTVLTRALQFQYRGDLQFTSFDGNTFSYKKMVTPVNEVRYSFDLSTSGQDETAKNTIEEFFTDLDSTGLEITERDSRIFRLSGSVGYYRLKHKYKVKHVSGYFGGGPKLFLSYVSAAYENTDDSFDAFILGRVSSSWSTQLGFTGIVGWEWHVSDAVSITAEYRLSLVGGYSESTTETRDVRTGDALWTSTSVQEKPNLKLSPGTLIGVSLFF